MIRIFVDSQSAAPFRGVESEQNFDQRGGLCQGGEGDIAITTHPVDSDYLEYWRGVGFSVPHLLTAGPFDSDCTLSDLIIRDAHLLDAILRHVDGRPARFEFFCIEESEQELVRSLDISAYCNFDVSFALSRKIAFKELCGLVGLPTPAWISCRGGADLLARGRECLRSWGALLVKSNDGTGGIACGGMMRVTNDDELVTASRRFSDPTHAFLVEQLVDVALTISLHWEIDDESPSLMGVFDQLGNFSYRGVSWPTEAPTCDVIVQLERRLWPVLLEREARGYFCCDVVIDRAGAPYWIDFNPRKGAILYVHSMVCRLSKILETSLSSFWHEHWIIPSGPTSFRDVSSKILSFLSPERGSFVVVTNPGTIRFGSVSLTGISSTSKCDARNVVEEVKCVLSGAVQ